MDGNAELLQFVYQNAGMGVETVERIMEIAEDARFRKQLASQLAEYRRISASAQEHLNRHGYAQKDVPAMQKFSAYMMINMKTLTDKSPSHIAEMMITGSTMGVIDAIKNIRKYADAEPDVLSLMQTLLTMEENNIKALKEFL